MSTRAGDGKIRILILGGYGVFGGRLATLLGDLSGATLFIAGRSLSKAQEFCRGYSGRADVRPIRLPREEVGGALAKLSPDLVVDASGPFQEYGAHRYGVVESCIENGINYLDFADAADFVFGISQYDDGAKAAGIFVLSGVSSFPVLTAAVLREMAKDMDLISVEGGIAPSPFAGVGLNVMRAVVSYAGAPVKLLRGGKQTYGAGLAETMRYTIAPPGQLPLRNIRFSLVDVPDLQVIPPEYPTLRDIWMGAGPVPELLHRILNLLATIRARLHLPSLTPFSRLFYVVLNLMKFGDHRGGMFVRARGVREGKPAESSWHLLAEGDDGPFIPSMAIEAIVRKMIAGDRPLPGARPATSALDLADYDRLFENRSITTGFRTGDSGAPIYPQLLGSAFEILPPQVRALHASAVDRSWMGRANVQRGRGLLARLFCALFGFPEEGDDVPVIVRFSADAEGERWIRSFGKRAFSSVQSCGAGRDQYLLVERFGVVAVSLALVVDSTRLVLVPRRWSILRIPMPKALLPKGSSFETEEDGSFRFHVAIELPLLGRIVGYRGFLEPDRRPQAG